MAKGDLSGKLLSNSKMVTGLKEEFPMDSLVDLYMEILNSMSLEGHMPMIHKE